MRYVIYNIKTAKYIQLDMSSGGYPYEVDEAWEARHWRNVDEAIDYCESFSREPWEIKQMDIVGSGTRLLPPWNRYAAGKR